MKEDRIECELGDLIYLKNGFAFKSTTYTKEGIQIIRIGDIQDWNVNENNAVKVLENSDYDKYAIKKGDILIAMSGATTGKFGVYNSNRKAYQNQRVGNLILRNDSLIFKPYVFYLLYSLKSDIEKKAYGGVQPNISGKKIEELQTILFPLPVQRAIVDKIEELFITLNKGIADFQKAEQQLKRYKQAILSKAFEGEFLKFKSSEKIQFIELGSFCNTTSGGTPSRKIPEYYKGSIPWVKSGELDKGIILDTEEKISEEALSNSSAKIFPRGTLLIALYGVTIGKMAFLGIDAATNQAICGIYKNEEINSMFLYYYLLFRRNDLISQRIGGAQNNISQTILKKMLIPVFKPDEQTQIVKDIESRLSVYDQIEQNISISLRKAEILRQSILKKAFRGELLSKQEVNNCKRELDYEPAFELLERIKSEKKK